MLSYRIDVSKMRAAVEFSMALLSPVALRQASAQGAGASVARQTPPGILTKLDTSQLRGMRYRMIGPSRGGRVTTVAGVPQEPMTFYMGTVGGGVWKTPNAGGRSST